MYLMPGTTDVRHAAPMAGKGEGWGVGWAGGANRAASRRAWFWARSCSPRSSRPRARSADLAEVENKLQQRFSTKVTIRAGRKGGKVEFEYYGREDLERLLEAWAVL